MTINDLKSSERDLRRVGRRVVLSPGLGLIQRDPTTVQVGFEPPRRTLICNAPPGTAELLLAFNGERTIADLTQRFAERYKVAVSSWDAALAELLGSGFLVDTSEVGGQPTVRRWSGSQPDRVALTLATGGANAEIAMTKRQDAIAVVIGSGRVAGSVATLLAAAGVGHVHLDPDRPVRPTDVVPAGLAVAEVTRLTESRAADAGRSTTGSRAAGGSMTNIGLRRRADRLALAEMIRRAAPQTSVHPPSGHLPPNIVVLATDGPPEQVQVRALMTDQIPHLAARASELRGVIGPLVLPGRSSCLHCHDLFRRDADPAWPHVLLAMHRSTPVPPAVLATSVAAIAAGQVLQFLDGQRIPDTVDGTLELSLGDWGVRRRSWQSHPGCFCQRP